ncbi:oxygen-independent coproporphyrinogen III oxidase [Paralcaligenes ureilyticus]|uniref:Coproporphyrinogen-III oxidase n=1 Tax=Paralcaligenes ureilyticus TaxID=627131 RepID=A0A4R3LT55_9BURK|nr:oxygen-independent coproporphyrinogen III oxidase [Paralcaligenes ureilyticus]TCT03036.1 anaerobic coproporphyrinogen III oxidase [Paralcaligenes ureilyticus]
MNTPSSGIEISEQLIRRFDRPGPRYTSYPTADRFMAGFTNESYIRCLQQRAARDRNPPLSIYVHLPFCEKLCYFCACNKVITHDHGRSAEYVRYLDKEMALVALHMGSDRRVAQLHLGGGTPTFLSDAELQWLIDALRRRFDFLPDAELSIEIDPRTVNANTMAMLAGLGFNRTSFGVQDFDLNVQLAVNRVQPLEMVEAAIGASRSAGFISVNIDLIYGLPKQSLDSFNRTLDQVIRLSPDRIALYNYAHLPGRFKAQRLIHESDLPSAEERLQIFLLSTSRLLEAGFVYIGLDHFAKPDDELNKARLSQSLHRNFQGYTTRAECDLLGLGVSAIGKVGNSYSQSVRSINDYYRRLDKGQLAIAGGIELTLDDQLRRQVIMKLMCSGPVCFESINRLYGVDFRHYFAHEISLLEPYQDAGLVEVDGAGIKVTAKGRLFVRAVGMLFDAYIGRPTVSNYSKLI